MSVPATMTNWAEKINRLVSNPSRDLESLGLLADFRDALNRGEVRAASREIDIGTHAFTCFHAPMKKVPNLFALVPVWYSIFQPLSETVVPIFANLVPLIIRHK